MRVTFGDTVKVHIPGWGLRKYIRDRWIEPHNSRRYYMVKRETIQDIHDLVIKSLLLQVDAFHFEQPLDEQQLRKLNDSLAELLSFENKHFTVRS